MEYGQAEKAETEIIGKIREYGRKLRKQTRSVKASEREKPYMIAVDGMCASGKTTLAEKVKAACPETAVIHMDDFFLTPEKRTEERLATPGGNVDYERFREEVIEPLLRTGSCRYRVYDCHSHTFVREEEVRLPQAVLIEGAYSRHPYFGSPYDAEYFLTVGAEEQKERIRRRNGEEMLDRFLEEWIPMENRYFESMLGIKVSLFGH